jgi:hypothetical protein
MSCAKEDVIKSIKEDKINILTEIEIAVKDFVKCSMIISSDYFVNKLNS